MVGIIVNKEGCAGGETLGKDLLRYGQNTLISFYEITTKGVPQEQLFSGHFGP